jgi:beta-lactamase regulating signal transducer with metallopeptidase domain
MDASQILVTFLVNATWQIPVMAAIAAMSSRLMRRAPAGYRHLVWVAALGLSLGIPLLSALSPGQNREAAKPIRPSVSVHENPPADGQSAFSKVGFSFRIRRHIRLVPLAPFLKWVLIGCYLTLIFYRALTIARAMQCTLRFRNMSYFRPLPGNLAAVAKGCADKFLVHGVEIACGAMAVGPVTVSFGHPILILPERFFLEVSAIDFSSALCHELAHIKRGDFLLNLLYELVYLPIWFHPAASLVKARIDVTRELACDEAAVRMLAAGGRRSYARSLLSIAQSLEPDSSLARPNYALGLFDTNSLEERIMNLIGKTNHLARTWAIVLAGVALSLLTTTALGVSAFSLQATQAASIPVDAKQFVGTWTAEHEGTPFIVLNLRSEKGKLAGGMRMANSFHMDNEGSAVNIEITDEVLLESLPVRDFRIHDKSLTFDFKDPDGDQTHWKLEVTGAGAGRLSWVGLPDGIKDVPLPVTWSQGKAH